MKKIKVGINGLGRIGRAIFRIIDENHDLEIVAVNDIDPLIENHAYLLNYDSLYGTLPGKVTCNTDNLFHKGKKIKFHSQDKISNVPWEDVGVNVVIDSSGIFQNVIDSHKIVDKNIFMS